MRRAPFFRFLFLSLPLLSFLSDPINVEDLAGWIAVGSRNHLSGRILSADQFSVYPTLKFVYGAAATQIYYWLYNCGGLILVSLFHKIALLLTLALIFKYSFGALRNAWGLSHLFVAGFCIVGMSPLFIDRPAILVLPLLLAGFLILDQKCELKIKDWIGLWILNVVWTNVHASSIVLLAICGWRVLTRRKPIDFLGSLILSVTYLATPFGTQIFDLIFQTRALSKVRGFGEWAPTTPLSFLPQSLMFYFMALALVAMAIKRARQVREWSLLASPFWVVLALGFDSVRNIPLVFTLVLPFAYNHGFLPEARALSAQMKERRILNAILSALVLTAIVASIPYVKPYSWPVLAERKRAVFDKSAPFKVAKYLRESPHEGAVFNGAFGGFLMLMQPRKIFVDFRNIIYGEAEFKEYLGILEPVGNWEELLEKKRARFIVLDQTIKKSKLLTAVEASPNWSLKMQDGSALLFERLGAAQF